MEARCAFDVRYDAVALRTRSSGGWRGGAKKRLHVGVRPQLSASPHSAFSRCSLSYLQKRFSNSFRSRPLCNTAVRFVVRQWLAGARSLHCRVTAGPACPDCVFFPSHSAELQTFQLSTA